LSRVCDFLNSSIGKKMTVALAGLLLCGFLVSHLAGNLFLLGGEAAFNGYAEALEHNPLLPIAEIGLLALFALHIATSLYATFQNKQARGESYDTYKSKGGRSIGSRTMAVSGTLLLAFIIVHVKTFRFTEHADGLYQGVMAVFSNPWWVGFYVLAMGSLALHLSHGVWSAFQTFGLQNARTRPLIRMAGYGFAAVIALGFAALPVWAYFRACKMGAGKACCMPAEKSAASGGADEGVTPATPSSVEAMKK
jgi:succinate dehydrogenase / fumarate reductase, cytochrome b subunit